MTSSIDHQTVARVRRDATVLKILKDYGPLSLVGLIGYANLPDDAVMDSLRRLKDEGWADRNGERRWFLAR